MWHPVGMTDAMVSRQSTRYGYVVAAALTVLGGAIPRVDNFARSLWAAEAWVANSVLADSLRGMFYYEKWLQTTPPLFLLLVRTTVQVFGLSDYSLRAVPLTLSIASLVLMCVLAGKMFRAPFALLCVGLMAISPSAILFSKELKQYSGDVFATCIILLVLWNYWQQPDREHYAYLLCAFPIMLLLSYTSLVFVPLAVWIVGGLETQGPKDADFRRRVRRCGGLAFVISLIGGASYWLFIKPNTSQLLNAFWEHGFPRLSSLGNAIHFYVENFVAMGIYFYFPAQSSTKDLLKSMVLSVPTVVQVAILAAALFLTAILVASIRKRRTHRLAAAFFFIPFSTLVVLNLGRVYPVGSRRLTLFMLPCVVVITAASAEAVWESVAVPRMAESKVRHVLLGVTVVLVASVLALGGLAAGGDLDWTQDEDTESAFRFIRSNVQAADTIYVHASVEEAARLYFKVLRWNTAEVRYGQTGFPCCKRRVEPRPKGEVEQCAYIISDFNRVMAGRLQGDLWLVFTARSEHWEYLNLNEGAIIQQRLHEIGCTRQREQYFENEVVYQYRCSS